MASQLQGEAQEVNGGEVRRLELLARELLAVAASAPDPRPLVDAAEALFEQARAAKKVLRLPPREAQA